jgi:hypothetical protein
MGVASFFLDFNFAMDGGRVESLDFSDAYTEYGAAAIPATAPLALRNRRLEIIIPPSNEKPENDNPPL